MNYIELIQESRRQVRIRQILRGLLLFFSFCAALVALLYVSARWIDTAHPFFSMLGLTVLTLFIINLCTCVIRPAVRSIPVSMIVNQVEHLNPEMKERLSTALYLNERPGEVEHYGFSPDMVQETLQWAQKEVHPEQFATFQSWSHLKRPAKIALFLALGWLALLGFDFAGVSRTVSGYLETMGYGTHLVKTLDIRSSGNLEVPRGESADVNAILSRPVAKAFIHYRQENRSWQSQEMNLVDQTGRSFAAMIPQVDAPISYYVSAEGQASLLAVIHPLDPPRIERFAFQVKPLPYTRREPFQVEKVDGNLEVLEGSRVEMTLTANNPLAQACIQVATYEPSLLQPTGTHSALVEFDLLHPLSYRIHLEDRRGMESRDLGPYQLQPIPDQPPQVFIHHPPLIMNLGERALVPVDWEVVDDYGISQVDLVFHVNYLDHERRIPLARVATEGRSPGDLSAPQIFEPTSTLRSIYPWDLSGLGLLPGDEVTYFIVAHDNDAIRGAKSATSEVHLIRFPTAYELFEEMQPRQTSQLQEMNQLLEQQRQIRQDAQQLRESIERRLEESRPIGERMQQSPAQWEEQQKMQQLGHRQEELGEDLQRLQSELQDTLQRLNEPGSFSLKTIQKMERIQDLLNQLLSDEMKMMMYQFQKTLEQIAREQPLDAMDDLQLSLEDFEENLDRMLALLESSMLEQQVEAMMRQAERLQQEQDALQEETQHLDEKQAELDSRNDLSPEEQAELDRWKEELARRQEELQARTEELLQQMQQMAQDQETRNPELSQSMQDALDEAQEQELSQSLQDAVEQLQSGQMRQAQRSQQSASQSMAKLQQNLSDMFGGMGGMDFQKDMVELRRALDRTLLLADRQERVAIRMAPDGNTLRMWGTPAFRNEITITQRYYRDEVLRIEEALRELARKDPFIDYEGIRLLRLSARAMNRGVEWADLYQPPQVYNQVRLALNRMNSAVVALLENLNDLAQAQAANSMGGYFQSLEQLIQRQQQINFRTREQKRQMGQVPDWQQQLQRLAQEQAEVRRRTEELFRKYGQLEQLLGDLDQAGQEMREVEKQLEDLQADDRLLEQQERILSRLLDAEKSVHEQGTSMERESEVAGEYTPEAPGELPETMQTIRNRIQKLRQGLGEDTIPPEFRERVRHYFRRLSEES